MDFSKFSKKDSKEIIEFCFKNTNRLPQINTLEEWLHAFITLLESECWSKLLDEKEDKEERERRNNKITDGCSSYNQAKDIANRARSIREGRFYNYIKDIIACHDTNRLAILSVKHKVPLITKDEYFSLGLNERHEITNKEANAIYMWKFAKDGQYEKDRVEKYRKILEDLGFFN